jgi:tetratricopeptide (TPR) repeat protein
LADTTIGTLQYRPLVHDLAAIVATKAPELIADVEKVAPQAKVRLAPYFLEVRDPRAVPFYESILAALPQPPSDKGALPVFKLSDYYAAIGDYTKAAETRLRMKDYTTNPQFLANSEVEAARFYMQIGEKEKAQKLYEGASRHGYGWATGLAIHDQSRALLEQGRHEEARKLLKTPITGQYADQIQTAVNSLLGTSYFQTGEWQESEKYSRLAVEGYKALVNPLQNEGMEVPVNVAEAQLYWSQLWLKQPFVTQPDHLQVNVRQGQSYEQPLLLNLAVRSPKSLAVEVTTDNDGVKPRLEGQPSDKGYFWHQGVVLEVASEKFEKDTTVTVKISSPESNQFVSNVLLQIEVQPAIRLFPDMIFFGEVSASNIAETTLEYASTQ